MKRVATHIPRNVWAPERVLLAVNWLEGRDKGQYAVP
jgi:hypothetical protein